jgi:predicted metal-binding membrane protein
LTPSEAVRPDTVSERAARNERWIAIAGLTMVAAIGLGATLKVGDMLMMPTAPSASSAAYAVLFFVMWWTMMMAMMLPSAAPAVLVYGAMGRRLAGKGVAPAPVAVFASGYATIWTAFSLGAVILQILFHDLVPLTGMMAVTSAAVGGSLLVAAGLYQMTPLKHACLRKCQSPLMFFARNWRPGPAGAFRMGLSHGLYCLGCCWVLMGLLFYGGVMELRWIAGIAAYIAAEKFIPAKMRIARFAGMILVVWGLWTIAAAFS